MTRPAPLITRILVLLVTLGALLLLAPEARAEPGWRWPVEGGLLTAYRNGDDPYAAGQHRGIDIAARAGTPVVAAAGGTVAFAGGAGDAGLTVSIRTADGRFDTSYLHLASAAVARGDAVSAGDALGRVGTSGRRSHPEPHLHFGVREAGRRHAYLDPLSLLPPPGAARPVAPEPAAVPALAGEPAEPQPVPVAPLAAEPLPAPVAERIPSLVPRPIPALAAEPTPALAVAAGAAATAGAAVPALADPRPSPSPDPSPAPALSPTPSPASGPSRAPALARGRLRPAPRLGPAPSAIRSRPHGAAPVTASHPDASPAGRSGGLDLGWLAACAGLVAIAGLLSAPRGPVASVRRARSLLASQAAPARPRA